MSPPHADAPERLDQVLVRRGLAPTRSRARALILAGRVFSGETRLEKPGIRIAPETPLRVRDGRRWVSRGAGKLLAAVERFALELRDVDALDVGASTGGFTQVLLEGGARRVIALDVGRGQLDWTLRQDPRVVPLEGINVRYLEPDRLPFRPRLAVIDVSFISLQRVLAPVAACLCRGWQIVALIKPQFEVGRGRVGRGGIVRDPSLHREVLLEIARHVRDRDWVFAGVVPSPVPGAEGNREFLCHILPDGVVVEEAAIDAALAEAAERGERP